MRQSDHYFKKKNNFLFNVVGIGVTSLILLPLCCFVYLNQLDPFKNEKLLSVYFWNIENPPYMGEGFNEYIKNKHYEHFYLSKSDVNNVEVYYKASKSIEKLVQSGDTINGIHFYIPDKVPFKTFIKTINLSFKLKAKIVIPFDNDIWILNPVPVVPEKNEIRFEL